MILSNKAICPVYAQRPLPTQTGDGSYVEHEEKTGVLADLKALGFKDAKTLTDVMRNKTKGEYVDDKTYLMEHTIQVSRRFLEARCIAHGVLACQWLAHKVKNQSRFDQCFHRRTMELFAASSHVLSWRQVSIQAG